MESTIASISTPLGKGAISIVRMSGEKSLEIATTLFNCKEKIEPRKLILGKFKLDEDVYEKCLMVYFKAPNSYTGEDIVEFQIHGGIIITQKVLESLLNNGAMLAEAGEFSKRAFLNGKIALTEAEAIAEVIDSESESELKANLTLAGGALFKKIAQIQNKLTELLAKIEVSMDYPEEDVEQETLQNVVKQIESTKQELGELVEKSESVKYLKSGINVALVGRTNVGKSSLLNALLGENKAIVSDVDGTTRDIVEGKFFYKGIKINLLDTAGIRETKDYVEKIGIEKSKDVLRQADLILYIFDGSEELTSEDKEIISLAGKTPFISVVNKTDKVRVLSKQPNEIEVSAKQEKNINELKEKIFESLIKNEINFNDILITSERQLTQLKEAMKIIEEIQNLSDEPMEIYSLLIKKLWTKLGKITGNTENEDIINLIFSKFCLGK